MAIRVLSLYDALSFPPSREVVEKNDEGLLYEMLYYLGFDVYEKHYEWQVCYHRPMLMPNKVIYTGRWVGEERSDDEWINSGYVSEEKRKELILAKDPYLYRDLLERSQYANWSGRMEQYLKEWWS